MTVVTSRLEGAEQLKTVIILMSPVFATPVALLATDRKRIRDQLKNEIPAMFTIFPRLATKCGHAARQSRTVPKNFRANPSAQSSVSVRKSPRFVVSGCWPTDQSHRNAELSQPRIHREWRGGLSRRDKPSSGHSAIRSLWLTRAIFPRFAPGRQHPFLPLPAAKQSIGRCLGSLR